TLVQVGGVQLSSPDAVAVRLRLARVNRKLNRFDEAEVAYTEAGELATVAGDRYSELLSRIGRANPLLGRGTLSEGERSPQRRRGARTVGSRPPRRHPGEHQQRAHRADAMRFVSARPRGVRQMARTLRGATGRYAAEYPSRLLLEAGDRAGTLRPVQEGRCADGAGVGDRERRSAA